MVNAGRGQLLADGEWSADIIYSVVSRPIGSYLQHQVRFATRRGVVVMPTSLQTLELICANGVHYQIRGELDLGAGGAYVADLIPLPVGVDII